MSNVLEKLTEGIVNRNVAKEGEALLNKWSATGLLEGLESDHARQGMACLLENQAKELLREESTMAAGDVGGFAAVAFPIVRRVFGGLLANDVVSVQPMSLPSGLIFFLDFTRNDGSVTGGAFDDNTSVHGGGKIASEIADGIADIRENGLYGLSQGYASPLGSAVVAASKWEVDVAAFNINTTDLGETDTANLKAIKFDPDLLADAEANGTGTGTTCLVLKLTDTDELANFSDLSRAATTSLVAGIADDQQVRRLTTATYTAGTLSEIKIVLVGPSAATGADGELADLAFATGATNGTNATAGQTLDTGATAKFAAADTFNAQGVGGVVGASAWALESAEMPEIDIKVDSVAITAQTKKLKAHWTPELGQDLNAYHNLDAEVELTSVLSEQIALEIDKEILNDLLQGAASTRYWSKLPGQKAGDAGALTAIDFTGNVSEWYETLVETINDASADIHRKTLRGGANFVVCGPEVANMLEFTSGFRAAVTHDADRGTVGAVKEGALNKKFDVYVDPYFPRNAVLVGRKGASFLESGYVYAPYVPLQTTPTIFDPADLTPRKGVMTRYGKKMVRPDMYAVVLVRDM